VELGVAGSEPLRRFDRDAKDALLLVALEEGPARVLFITESNFV
jgi:hypothetical protein